MKLYIKHILLVVVLMIPFALFGQTKEDYQRIYEDLKAKGYNIDSDKIRSLIEDEFVVGDSISKIMLILDKERTKYNTMEEASMEVESLLNRVAKDRNSFQRRNGALAVRIGENAVVKNKERDRIARDAWTDLVKSKEATTEDFVALYEKFGDRPTYYVNSREVGQDVLNRLHDSDVVTREYRVKNTISGNPNGEIWYTITEKAAKRVDAYLIQSEKPTSNVEQVAPIAYEEKVVEEPVKTTITKNTKEVKKKSVRTIKESRKNKN